MRTPAGGWRSCGRFRCDVVRRDAGRPRCPAQALALRVIADRLEHGEVEPAPLHLSWWRESPAGDSEARPCIRCPPRSGCPNATTRLQVGVSATGGRTRSIGSTPIPRDSPPSSPRRPCATPTAQGVKVRMVADVFLRMRHDGRGGEAERQELLGLRHQPRRHAGRPRQDTPLPGRRSGAVRCGQGRVRPQPLPDSRRASPHPDAGRSRVGRARLPGRSHRHRLRKRMLGNQ